MNGGIYSIRFETSDKLYVGRTLNFKTRKATHIWQLRKNIHHCKYLQNVFNKYGEFIFVEELIENDKEKRIQEEQKWIDKYKNSGLLLNHQMIVNDHDNGGGKWNKEKIRIPHNKGVPSPFKGIKRSDEVKMKISETKKKNGVSEKHLIAFYENVKKMDRHKKRVPMSDETKEKLRIANLGKKRKKYSEDHGKKISAARKGMKFTEEHINNLKISAKKRWNKHDSDK